MSFDYHLHTQFSDGYFSMEYIIECAISKSIHKIAFTDHYMTRKTKSITWKSIELYLKKINYLKHSYRDNLTIFAGLEIDTHEMVVTDLKLTEIPQVESLDFLIFEGISNHPPIGVPLMFLLDISGQCSIPMGLAHTDIERAFPSINPNDLIEILHRHHIFIELNESYHRANDPVPYYHYYSKYFNAIKKHGLRLSIGSDMHRDISRLGANQALRFLGENGLKNQIIQF